MNGVMSILILAGALMFIGIVSGFDKARDSRTEVTKVCVDGVSHLQTAIANKVIKLEPLYNQGQLVICEE